jgi:hypothetical protein
VRTSLCSRVKSVRFNGPHTHLCRGAGPLRVRHKITFRTLQLIHLWLHQTYCRTNHEFKSYRGKVLRTINYQVLTCNFLEFRTSPNQCLQGVAQLLKDKLKGCVGGAFDFVSGWRRTISIPTNQNPSPSLNRRSQSLMYPSLRSRSQKMKTN